MSLGIHHVKNFDFKEGDLVYACPELYIQGCIYVVGANGMVNYRSTQFTIRMLETTVTRSALVSVFRFDPVKKIYVEVAKRNSNRDSWQVYDDADK